MIPPGDRILVRGLRAFGRHGVLPEEQASGQTFVVDVTLQVDLRRAGHSDALADTLDYGALCTRLAHEVGATRFDLIEALAEHLASVALEDQRVRVATVRVTKPDAPVDVEVDAVAVEVERSRRGKR